MTFYTVVWDYVGGDCGDLPGTCATEAEAVSYGEGWVLDTLADMSPAERDEAVSYGEGMPVYHVVKYVDGSDGIRRVYDDEGALIREEPLEGIGPWADSETGLYDV